MTVGGISDTASFLVNQKKGFIDFRVSVEASFGSEFMSTSEKKTEVPPSGQTASSPPAQPRPTTTQSGPKPITSATPPPPTPNPEKGPLISRRAFMIGAVLASAGLATASIASGAGIFSPLIPPPKPETSFASTSEQWWDGVQSGPLGNMPWKLFYWPYEASASPYYRNILVRVPDAISSQTSQADPWSASDPSGTYAAYNTTCVHLQCLVNAGFADNQYRLQCPCHGSQYEITDGVPQKGPAFLLNLGRLPRIRLSIRNGNIYAEELEGTPGLGIK